jgi:two-component system sensor histidine kinase YesM
MTNAAFVFAPESNTLIDEVSSSDDYMQRQAIRIFLRNYVESANVNIEEWFAAEINQKNYFFRMLKNDSTYIGTWISMNKLLDPFLTPGLVRLDYVMFADTEGNSISHVPDYFTNSFDIEQNEENIYTSLKNERYIYINRPSESGPFSLLAFMSEREVLAGLLTFRILFVVLFLLIFIMIIVILVLQRITILRPVENLVSAMQNVQAGHWDIELEETNSSSEFRLLNKTYNSMIREIKQLKINIYEEKLMKQKAELNFFQLQIRPHFLINALNIIYNLAQIGKFALIQRMSRYLIRHFQYTIKSNASLVSIGDEIYYTKNYIAIQELRFPDSLESSFDIDDSLMKFSVPPLSIQTFVENSIKYAMSIEEPVKLSVSIKTYEPDISKLAITVKDSGPGFPEKILESLSKNEKIEGDNGEHIGIYNVVHRLQLLFDDGIKVIFSNDKSGGAEVEMIIPKTCIGEMKQND